MVTTTLNQWFSTLVLEAICPAGFKELLVLNTPDPSHHFSSSSFDKEWRYPSLIWWISNALDVWPGIPMKICRGSLSLLYGRFQMFGQTHKGFQEVFRRSIEASMACVRSNGTFRSLFPRISSRVKLLTSDFSSLERLSYTSG